MQKIKELENQLYSYYVQKKIPIWIYNNNLELCFTNFTDYLMLHLIDSVKCAVRNYVVSNSVKGFSIKSDFPFELYYFFTWKINSHSSYTIVIGPVLCSKPSLSNWNKYSFCFMVFENQREDLLNRFPVMQIEDFLFEISSYILPHLFDIVPPNFSDLLCAINKKEFQDCSEISECFCKAENNDLEAINRQNDLLNIEEYIKSYISFGNVFKLTVLLNKKENISVLFPCSFSNFESISRSAELITIGRIAAINGGCGASEAYTISSAAVQALSKASGKNDMIKICCEYLNKFGCYISMNNKYISSDYSPLINEGIQTIISLMPDRVSLDEVACRVHLSSKYFSALFCKETGYSFTDFVTNIRINLAKKMLTYSSSTYLEISNTLNFSSQSYFNFIFKKKTGLTPKEYRYSASSSKLLAEQQKK